MRRRVKTVEESASIRGYAAHKCVKGRKRHLLVDTLGLPLSVYITPADVHDTRGARCLLAGLAPLVPRLKKIWADGAYRGQELADWCKAEGDWDLEVVERDPGTRCCWRAWGGEHDLVVLTPPFSCCGCLAAHAEIQTPVIAPHEAAPRVLELTFLDQCEPQLPADRVGGEVVNRWEGVQKPMFAVRPGHGNSLFGRRACDAPPLERREHLPPDLIDRFATPGAFPVDDRPSRLAAGLEDNLEDPGRAFLGEPQEAGVALGNLFVALGAAQMLGHLRVPHQLFEQR